MPPSGAFASSAHQIASHGLAVLPLGGDDGKVPLVKNWNKWKRPPGVDFLDKLAAENPTANVGIVCGVSGITVLDIDDPAATDDLIRACGDTPLKVQTPSGGLHLYYRHNSERCANLRPHGFDADMKARGGIVTAPPSTRPGSGHSYTFIEGGWSDLDRLPLFQPLVMTSPEKPIPVTNKGTGSVVPVTTGQRNDALFRAVLQGAHDCATVDDALMLARRVNESFCPLLSYSEVIRTALSAWKYHVEGSNWNGQEAHVSFPLSLWSVFDEKPDALSLFGHLRAAHGERLEPFAVSPKSMAKASVIQSWEWRRYRSALMWLLSKQFLREVHRGGTKPGDPSLYMFGPAAPKGYVSRTQYNLNIPPRSLPPYREGK